MGITEDIIMAALTVIGSVVAALIAARSDAKRTAEAMYTQLCDDQQSRIQQLQSRLDKNEQELERLRAELVALRQENITLRNRVRVLEDERAELLAEIAKLKNCSRTA